ncbi:Alpha/Beta hydrolase protein, partial [Pelagophyceae sp. CCMP2097]
IVIFLRGAHDTGPDARAWLARLAGPHLGVFALDCPSAAPRPYSLRGGAVASVWFDRVGYGPDLPEDAHSLDASAAALLKIIDSYVAAGVPPAKIAIGGFSQGGCMAYHAAAQWHADATNAPLGAVFALPSYLSNDAAAYALAAETPDRWPPVLALHGDVDDLHAWGARTAARLSDAGVDVEFETLPGVAHHLSERSVSLLWDFLHRHLDAPGDSGGRYDGPN